MKKINWKNVIESIKTVTIVALAYRIYKDRRSWDISGWRAWTSCWDGKVKCY